MLQTRISGRAVLAFFAVLLGLVAAQDAWAQTTGQLRVQVVDSDMELPIPSVAVTLTGDSLIGGKQERNSDANGEVSFIELLPGVYEITAVKAGFQTVTVRNIQVNINRTVVQVVKMPTGGTAEELEVKAKAKAVDVESTGQGQVLTKEFLQRMPAGRDYHSAIQMAAGVIGTGNASMGGGAYNENTFLLDGVNITDPVTGTFSVNFNFDAIEQIEVLLGGYMPEYEASTGGVTNLVTSSGTNNLKFDTSVYYENGNWAPKMDQRLAPDGLQIAPTGFDSHFESFNVNALVSGPIVRDRAWFFVGYQMARSLIARTGVLNPRDYEGHYVLAKLTVQPTAEHRFTGMIQLDPTIVDNTQQAVWVKPQAQGRQAQGGFVTQARWQWFISPDVNLDTMFSGQKSYLEGSGVPCTHNDDLGYNPCLPGEREGTTDWETPGRIGQYGAFNDSNYLVYDFDDRWNFTLKTALSMLSVKDPLGGSHDFKFGIGAQQFIWDRLFGYTGNTQYIDLNTVGYDPTTLENWYWVEISGPVSWRSTSSNWHAYAQDSWKPVSNLTINYGSRFDSFVARNDRGEPTIRGALFGPRLFAAWDPFKDQRTKIAAGYGRFNDTGRMAVADFTSASSIGSKLFLGEAASNGDVGFLNNQQNMYSFQQAVNYNTRADKMRTPRVDELLLTLEREVVEDVAVFSDMSARFTRFLYEPEENNLVWDSDGSSTIGSRLGDSSQVRYRLRTPSLAKRDYFRWNLGLRKIHSRRWMAEVIYTHTKSIGSSTQANSGSFAIDPQTRFNYGPLNTDRAHMVKASAFWDLPTDPWTATLGAFVQYYSGMPLERLYWMENAAGSPDGGYGLRIAERGTYLRFGSYWELRLRYTQAFDLRKGQLLLDLEASNILNNRAPVQATTALYSENRLATFARQDPFRLMTGIRYNF